MRKPSLEFAASMLLVVALMAGSAIAQTAPIEIKDVWARATPGRAENGAAYLTIESPQGDRLTSVSTSVARMAELHTMKMEGGVMRMSPLAAIDLPAGQLVTLKPGAMHIMLVGLKQPLQAGQSIPLTLHFEKGGTREIVAAVGKVGATAPEGHAQGSTPAQRPAGH